MGLATDLLTIYPDLDLLNDVRLRDDGAGVYIDTWNDPRPQPTAQEIIDVQYTTERRALYYQVDELADEKSGIVNEGNQQYDGASRKLHNKVDACMQLIIFQDKVMKGGTLTGAETTRYNNLYNKMVRVITLRANNAQKRTDIDNTLDANLATFDVNTGWSE